MGITKLAHLIHFDAPVSMRNNEIGDYSGKIIALDTSIVVNQFRTALPSHLKLSPLTGLFYRTLTFLEHDIKPVFVLDGRPPSQKRAVLEKRAQITGYNCLQSSNTDTSEGREHFGLRKRLKVPEVISRRSKHLDIQEIAMEDDFNISTDNRARDHFRHFPALALTEAPDLLDVAVVTRGSNFKQDCLRLLKLMGVPCIQAPGEAEALCAHLVKSGTVNAVASEDMDTLAFGGTVLLRQLNAKRDSEVTEYSLPKLLDALQLTYKQFVDLCILLGCDYCDKIGGLGPSRALKLIKQHHTIEGVMEHVNKKTHPIPPNWQYKDARKLFFETPQIDDPVLAWSEPDEEGLVQFLCKEKPMKEERVRGRMRKFRESLLKRRKQRKVDEKMGLTRQSRLEDYFPATRRRKAESAAVGGSSRRKQAKIE